MIELIPPVLLPSDAILNFTVRSSLASEKKKNEEILKKDRHCEDSDSASSGFLSTD